MSADSFSYSVLLKGSEIGPLTEAEVSNMVLCGILAATDVGRRTHEKVWRQIGQMAELGDLFAADSRKLVSTSPESPGAKFGRVGSA